MITRLNSQLFQLANILWAFVLTVDSLKLWADREKTQIVHFFQGFMLRHCIGGWSCSFKPQGQ